MSSPVLIRENYISDDQFKRAVRDAVNRVQRNAYSGTTAQRPPAPVIGQQYYDGTIGKPIWFNGTVWKDASGATV